MDTKANAVQGASAHLACVSMFASICILCAGYLSHAKINVKNKNTRFISSLPKNRWKSYDAKTTARLEIPIQGRKAPTYPTQTELISSKVPKTGPPRMPYSHHQDDMFHMFGISGISQLTKRTLIWPVESWGGGNLRKKIQDIYQWDLDFNSLTLEITPSRKLTLRTSQNGLKSQKEK